MTKKQRLAMKAIFDALSAAKHIADQAELTAIYSDLDAICTDIKGKARRETEKKWSSIK